METPKIDKKLAKHLKKYGLGKKPIPIIRQKKIGRNDKCICGSGKKYKKCCLNKTQKKITK